ncbi:hypothetical protein GOV04_03705 [Candidatus Woesearchaeota archaeon]|nr:hypothetical protein [Candidatus Woesearchaeota archaeon]
MSKLIINKKSLVYVVIILFLITGFFVRFLPFTQGDVQSDQLPVVVTFDNFYHPHVAKWFYDSEQAKYTMPFKVLNYQGINLMPPIFYVLEASFAKVSGLSFYQSYFFFLCALLVFTSLQAYLIAKRFFGSDVGLVTFALTLFPAMAYYFVLLIGFSLDIGGFFFSLATIYLFIINIKKDNLWLSIIIGLLLAASFLIHVVESIALIVSFFLVLGVFYALKKVSFKSALYQQSTIIVSFLLVIAYVLPLLFQGLLYVAPTSGSVGEKFLSVGLKHQVPQYYAKTTLSGLILLFTVIGLLVIAFNYKKIIKDNQKMSILIVLLSIVIASSVWKIGINPIRSYRIGYWAYYLLMLLPAIAICTIAQSVKKNVLIKFVMIILLAGLIILPQTSSSYEQLKAVDANPLVNTNGWNAIKFVRDNTPVNTTLFELYGFEHEYGMLSERVLLKGDLNLGDTVKNMEFLCQGEFPESFIVQLSVWNWYKNNSLIPTKRVGFSSFESEKIYLPNKNDQISKFEKYQNYSYSELDYVVARYRNTQADSCIAFFINESVERGANIVYLNDEFIVLKT